MKKIYKYIIALASVLFLLYLLIVKKDIPVQDLIPQYTNPYSAFINIDGMNVHYRIEGEGKPIILIHGTGSCLQTWDIWTDSLKKYYQVIRLDMPGFGLTGPRQDKDYSIVSYVSFLDKFTQKLQIEKFAIAGNSLGGQIAWNFALEFPNKVSELVLINSAGFYDKNKKGKSLVFNLAKQKWIATLLQNADTKIMVNNTLEEVYHDDTKIAASTRKMYHDMSMRAGNRQAFIDRVQTIKDDPTNKNLAALNLPTLILWGKEDLLINVSVVDTYKTIQNAKAIIYENVGHSPQEEIPTTSVQDFMKFLKN